jgi:hypothetical protein
MVRTRSTEDRVLDIPMLSVGHGQAPLALLHGPSPLPPPPHLPMILE